MLKPEKLRELAEMEARCRSISVGGLLADNGLYQKPENPPTETKNQNPNLDFARHGDSHKV